MSGSDHPEFWAGNQNPSISDVVEVDGVPVDLSTYSGARFKARKVGVKTPLLVDQPVANALGSSGLVQYDWLAGDIAANGILDANLAADYQAIVWWELTKGGRKQDVNEAIITIRAHAPVSLSYVELEVFKASQSLVGTNFADQEARNALVAASRGIDKKFGRRFYLDTVDQTRYYTAPERCWHERHRRYDQSEFPLRIDDLVTLTTLQTAPASDGVLSQTWAATDFVLEPRSAPADGLPYTSIRRLPAGAFYWPRWADSVAVTGRFGWPAVPEAIQTMTKLIAARLLKRTNEAPFGIIAFGVDQAVVRAFSIANDPEFNFVLETYSRRRLFV